MGEFRALDLALEVIEELSAVIEDIERRDRNLAEQLRESSTSAASCLAEGAQRRGKDRLHFYRVASGSAGEAKMQLRIAIAWRYVSPARVGRALRKADELVAVTFRLANPR